MWGAAWATEKDIFIHVARLSWCKLPFFSFKTLCTLPLRFKHLWLKAQRSRRRSGNEWNDMQLLVCELLITFLLSVLFLSLSLPPRSLLNTKTCKTWLTRFSFSINQSRQNVTWTSQMGNKKKVPYLLAHSIHGVVNCLKTYFSFNNDHLHDLFTSNTV